MISFAPWITGGTTGIVYGGMAFTSLATDINPANDTMSFSIIITPQFWEILADLPVQSSGHYGATIYDGFYMIFGIHSGGQYLDDTYIYDIVNDAWSQGPDNPYGCGAYGMAFGVDSIYYRIGGTDGWPTPLDRVDIYAPGTGSWSSGASMPIPNMDMAGGVYEDSLIYMFGGGNWGGVPLRNDVYFYDVYENTWTQATSYPGQARGCLAGGIVGDYAIVACGYDGTSNYLSDYIVGNIDPSNPANITWGTPTAIPGGFEGRYRLCYAVDPSSEPLLWLTGGHGVTNSVCSDLWSYDPGTDIWTNWNMPNPFPIGNLSCCAMTYTALGDIGFFIAGSYTDHHVVFHTGKFGIEERPVRQDIPSVFGFAAHMKNPTAGYSCITYTTTKPGKVTVKVYDNTGRLVKTLADRAHEPAGIKTVFWNAKDDESRTVANGVYFLRLETEGKEDTYKMILVK